MFGRVLIFFSFRFAASSSSPSPFLGYSFILFFTFCGKQKLKDLGTSHISSEFYVLKHSVTVLYGILQVYYGTEKV